MPLPHASLPDRFGPRLRAALEDLGYSVDSPGRLSDAVVRLSDHYLANPDARSPLTETWAQAAYLAYFFPLNYARARAAVDAGAALGFFEGLTSFVDFGSGLGSASFALFERGTFPAGGLAIDASRAALELQARLAGDDLAAGRLRFDARADAAPPKAGAGERRLASFSYALTELNEMPRWALECEAIFVLEPSSREDGRRLQELRGKLIQEGFHIWAPCAHQDACPLLAESDRDWCHMRAFHRPPPPWWAKLEARLPMKNRTVTYSYLLARRTPPPVALNGATRVVGDPLDEKGRARIAICRGPRREFLAWFPKRMKREGTGPAPELERGDLFRLPNDLEIRGEQAHSRELRLQTAAQIESVLPDDAR